VAKKYRDVKRILRAAGWVPLREGKGSHELWVGPDGDTVALATGGKENREVPTGTLASIRRETGLRDLR